MRKIFKLKYLLLFLVAGAVIIFFLNKKTNNVIKVQIDVPERKTLCKTIYVKGKISNDKKYSLVSKHDNYIENLNATLFQIFNKNQVLVSFSDSTYLSLVSDYKNKEKDLKYIENQKNLTEKKDYNSEINVILEQIEINNQELSATETQLKKLEEKIDFKIKELEKQKETNQKTETLMENGLVSESELSQNKLNLDKLVSEITSLQLDLSDHKNKVLGIKNSIKIKENQLSIYEMSNSKEKNNYNLKIKDSQLRKDDLNSSLKEEKDRIKEYQQKIYSKNDVLISNIYVESGQFIKAGEKIISYYLPEENYIALEMNQKYLKDIYNGKNLKIKTLDGDYLETIVYQTSDMITERTDINSKENIFLVKCKIPDKLKAKFGMEINLQIEIEKIENAISVPISATLTDSLGNSFVFTVENNLLKKKNVQLGLYSDSHVAVSGLDEKDKIVTEMKTIFYDGTKVEITK